MTRPTGGWSRHPDGVPGDSAAEEAQEQVSGARIVGLGALCGLRAASTGAGSQSFSVAEFALLDDGRRILLHQDRGFTLGPVVGGPARPETVEGITESVLNVVLPDEWDPHDPDEDHPWSWLARLAGDRGLRTSAEELRTLPYEVVLSDDVTRWIATG
jgi:hypothetical protein